MPYVGLHCWLQIIACFIVAVSCISNPEEYVNILGGTENRFDFSSGNQLPGFNGWAPMSDVDSFMWFHPTDKRFFGIRCTHQPSPWISDYGQFLITASITDPHHDGILQYSGYDLKKSEFRPYYFSTELLAYGTRSGGYERVELTSTSHGAAMRVTYPPFVSGPTSDGFNQTRRVMVTLNNPKEDSISVDADSASIYGWTRANSGGVPIKKEGNTTVPLFQHAFHLTVTSGVNSSHPVPVLLANAVSDEENGVIYATLDFDPTNPLTQVLEIRVGTSLISVAQALVNRQAEVDGHSFTDLVAASKSEWNAVLSRMEVVSVGQGYTQQEQHDALTVFYSCLYRASLFPRQLYEMDKNGNPVHYSPYDEKGRVFPGVLSSDSGFWDAYRTLYPLLSIVHPQHLGTILQGWVNAYKEGGWLPKWASPGYRLNMVGTLGDVTLADAIVKNISGFDVNDAYAAIRQDAFVVPPWCNTSDPDHLCGIGRVGLGPYLEHGYIPRGVNGTTGPIDEVVSRTMNYMVSDFAIAQAAKALGKDADAAVLMMRAKNYGAIFDPRVGFFRSRYENGSWTEPFDEFEWGNDYTEAGPWQYRFYVPYDPAGLRALYAKAGLDMCERLQVAQTIPSIFHIGGYGIEIHEQTEMALNCWGQYEHNNQPVHHMLYMFIAYDESVTGACAAQGQYWIRQALTRLYKPGVDMFCGDEDNGEMSAWYLLSALGLYSLAPGTPDYMLGSPLFEHVCIHLENSNTLEIVAPNNNGDTMYVHGVSWNGAAVSGITIPYEQLMRGGTLEFTVGKQPRS